MLACRIQCDRDCQFDGVAFADRFLVTLALLSEPRRALLALNRICILWGGAGFFSWQLAFCFFGVGRDFFRGFFASASPPWLLRLSFFSSPRSFSFRIQLVGIASSRCRHI